MAVYVMGSCELELSKESWKKTLRRKGECHDLGQCQDLNLEG